MATAKNKGMYKTRDLGEAACLFALEYELLELEDVGLHYENQKLFVFVNQHPFSEDMPPAAKTAELYRAREQQVDAQAFYLATRELKSRIYGTAN